MIPPPLADNEVHLWYVRPDKVLAVNLWAQYYALLSPEERTRWSQLTRPEARQEFLISRALVRTVLSLYAEVTPADWRFIITGAGKPKIAAPTNSMPLIFNLAHTRELVLCGVALGTEIGVDTEHRDRPNATPALARRYFAPAEVAYLERLPPDQWKDGFFRIWTLKEAYLKARGLSVTMPLDAFAFDLESGLHPQVAFMPPLVDKPAHWRFASLHVQPDHLAAVALRVSDGEPLRVTLQETVPLLR